MPEFKFTKRSIDEIPYAEKGQILYRDTQLRGLGLRVGRASKVYFAEGQVQRRTKRISIGRADVFAPEIARKKALALLSGMAEGTIKEREQEIPTVAAAFEKLILERQTLSSSTRDSYARSCSLYLRDWNKRLITDVSRADVLERHQTISERRGKVTANNVFRHLRAVYNYTAVTLGELPPNPVEILSQARAWNAEKRRRGVVRAPDLPAWWRTVEADTADASDLLRLAVLTGMRRGELVTLRWENIDFACRTLSLPSTKNGDPLDLPLSDYVLRLLDERRNRVGQSEWVFPSKGRTGHLVEVKSIVQRIERNSGVSFMMHDLRRTFVTIAESMDIPHYALKRLLNHRTSGDVTGGYIVIDAERLREPMERVSARILELANAK